MQSTERWQYHTCLGSHIGDSHHDHLVLPQIFIVAPTYQVDFWASLSVYVPV